MCRGHARARYLPTPRIHPTAVIGDPPEHRDYAPGRDFAYQPIIHPTARINAFVTVDAGLKGHTYVGPHAFLMAHCHVGHDAHIGDDCELAPGTVIGGHAKLGNGVRCGIGVLVLPGKEVGDAARLGAGAVVTKDVPVGETWVGNPAKPLRKCLECGTTSEWGNPVQYRRGYWAHRECHAAPSAGFRE